MTSSKPYLVRALYEEVLGTPPDEERIVVIRVLDEGGRSQARIESM